MLLRTPNPMTDATLLRKLVLVVLIKLVAIVGLWWLFVRDERVTVAADNVAEHLAQPVSTPAKLQGKTDGH